MIPSIGCEESRGQSRIRFLLYLKKITRGVGVGIGIGIGEHREDIYISSLFSWNMLIMQGGIYKEQQGIIAIHHPDSIVHMRYI